MIRRGIGRVGRPSLLGTAARTAVVAGTATAVVGGMSRHQQEKAQTQADAAAYQQMQEQAVMEQAAAQQAATAPAPGADPVTQLERLAELKSQGVLTEEEFAAEKAKILAR